jgi:hypothetical protein
LAQTAERVSVEAGAEESSLLSRKFFDEMRTPDGTVRHAYAELAGLLDNLSIDSLVTKQNCAVCRTLGVPVRYVSGYLTHGEGHDAHAASHGWA